MMDQFDYLSGVYNIAPTPFSPDGSLDRESIVRLTDFTLEKGVHGITILGVMGEASKVSDVERESIVAAFLEAADGRVPICVGTSHAATGRCVAYSEQAQAMGARAVMVAPPRLARSTHEALRRHYLAVAEAIDIPVVIQDHPASSGVFMSVESIAQIAHEAPQCRFLKLEDEPSPPKISKVLAANPDVRIFGGLGGEMILEELRPWSHRDHDGFCILRDTCRHLSEIHRWRLRRSNRTILPILPADPF